ncbi:hypothetical protein RSK20926_21719 [Roseobacter sp. SK209-2-6]|uniref:gp16 family protein n=1 Tax=Roseobacter sp. SK209-2-6 TaxID=388739 RepID=UPI0000F3F249|nr:regulatory protein GemA [Roseobacter sp. SK209-2-6]EBA16387.1 hypothetical protein RSK20926_21719 [Roseobacter sp. SK209-2-6]
MKCDLQKKIHVGCCALGIDSDARRALRLAVTGKASMTDMNTAELNLVLDRLKDDGFKVQAKGKSRPQASRQNLRLVHVLWKKLGEAGVLEDPSRKGLNSFIRARFHKVWGHIPLDVDALRDQEKIDQVIQALKAWGQRVEIEFNWTGHGT